MPADALVFDDDTYFAQLILEILKDQGLSAKHFPNGENALENIRQEMPNLVLLDVMMPGMDGLSICKLIKSDPKLSWMKVAIISAKAYMEDKTRAAWGKADLYVQKPFNIAEFSGQIHQLAATFNKGSKAEAVAEPTIPTPPAAPGPNASPDFRIASSARAEPGPNAEPDAERVRLKARIEGLEKESLDLRQAKSALEREKTDWEQERAAWKQDKSAWEQEKQALIQDNNRMRAAMESALEEEQAKFSSAQIAWEREREEQARKRAELEKRTRELEKRVQELEAARAAPPLPAPVSGMAPGSRPEAEGTTADKKVCSAVVPGSRAEPEGTAADKKIRSAVVRWKVRFWGLDAGPNCLSFSDGNKLIVLDSGSGLRELAKEPAPPDTREVWVLVNHAHQDHLQGLSHARHWLAAGLRLNVIGPEDGESPFAGLVKRVLPFTGVSAHAVSEGEFRHIPGLRAAAQFTMHPGPCLAYRLEGAGGSLVFVSDNELALTPQKGDHSEKLISFAHGANLLIHDARYGDHDYPAFMGRGHSAWQPVLRLALGAGARRLVLYHIDAKYSKAEKEAMSAALQAQKGSAALECLVAESGLRVEV